MPHNWPDSQCPIARQTNQTKPKEWKRNREYIILKPTNLSAEQRTKYQTYFHLIYFNDHQLNHWPTLLNTRRLLGG